MKHLFTIALFTAMVGCGSAPQVYNNGITKHPVILTIEDDGTYQLEHRYADKEIEQGRWAIKMRDSEMEIVLLQPNDSKQKNQYAYLINPKDNLVSLWLYDDMRSIWINHFPKSNVVDTNAGIDRYER